MLVAMLSMSDSISQVAPAVLADIIVTRLEDMDLTTVFDAPTPDQLYTTITSEITGREYLVAQKLDNETTWEPEQNLENARELIAEFEATCPKEPEKKKQKCRHQVIGAISISIP